MNRVAIAFLLSILVAASSLAADELPTVDLSTDATRQTVIAAGTPTLYQGHPTTLLMPDGKTLYCVWTLGHGGPCGPMKRSDDGGKAWSDLLPTPPGWTTVRNCPAIYRLKDPKGVARLFVFAGQGPDKMMASSFSEDEGKTWSPMKSVGLVCVMPFCTIEPIENGKKLLAMTNIRRPGETKDPKSNVVAQSLSEDGGLTWSPWRIVLDIPELKPCEPWIVRSPDGKQLLCLMRENTRTVGSLFMTSDDEGQTWSAHKTLPPGLHGDRHVARYAPGGRLVVCFRDTGRASPFKNHFVAWVGRYEDIAAGREGQCRVKLLTSHAGGDCGYPGVEVLPDGAILATTYVKHRPGPEKHSVVSVRFTLKEIDERMKKPAEARETSDRDRVIALMQKVNAWQLAHPWTKHDPNWIRGTYYTGVMALHRTTGDPAILQQALDWATQCNWAEGTEREHANKMTCGQTYLELYAIKKDPPMIAKMRQYMDREIEQALPAKKIWYYCDTLYVGPPALAMMSQATGNAAYRDYMSKMYWDVVDELYDKDDHLFYRDKRFIPMRTTGGKKIFWSRGNGWVLAGLPRVLEHLPKEDPQYPKFTALFKDLSAAVAKAQAADGLWRANLADPDHVPNPETSGSAFFCYALAWGINQRVLDRDIYLPIVQKAWQGLTQCINDDGRLGFVQPVGDQPKEAKSDQAHEYATGAFLLAGSEMVKLLKE